MPSQPLTDLSKLVLIDIDLDDEDDDDDDLESRLERAIGEDRWTVSDDGGDYDEDLPSVSRADADAAVEERADYYRAQGMTVVIRENGIKQ